MSGDGVLRAAFIKIIGAKKLQILELIIDRADENGFVQIKASEICELCEVSKPTALATISLLKNRGVLTRVKNGLLRLEI